MSATDIREYSRMNLLLSILDTLAAHTNNKMGQFMRGKLSLQQRFLLEDLFQQILVR